MELLEEKVAVISGNYQSYIVSVHNPAPIDMVNLLVRKYQLYQQLYFSTNPRTMTDCEARFLSTVWEGELPSHSYELLGIFVGLPILVGSEMILTTGCHDVSHRFTSSDPPAPAWMAPTQRC